MLGNALVSDEECGLDRVYEDESGAATSRHRIVGEQRAAYDEGSKNENRLDDVDGAPEAIDESEYRSEERHPAVYCVRYWSGELIEGKYCGG